MKTLTLTLPTSARDLKLKEKVSPIKKSLTNKKSLFLRSIASYSKSAKSAKKTLTSKKKARNMRGGIKLPEKGVVKKIGLLLTVFVLLVIAARLLSGKDGRQDGRAEVMGAKAVHELEKEYVFPLNDSEGNAVSDIKFKIGKAELRDEIIVQGQRASSVKGRTFLILDLKIKNEHDQAIQINTRDYVRLTMNGSSEDKKAPDIHNDPVQIQAISTKDTRLGFPVNDTDEDLILEIGEINGEKDLIELNL